MHSSRRQFIIASAASALILSRRSRAQINPPQAQSEVAKLDFTTADAFDFYDHAWNQGNGNADHNNEHGALGWGEGWLLQAYMLMYQAHRDTRYLDNLIAHVDQVLEQRDSERGVKDWRGHSLPTWRSAGHYTCGELTLATPAGAPVLRLRCGARPAHHVKILVEKGSAPSTFNLVATIDSGDRKSASAMVDRYDSLSMDSASPDFAITRINGAFAEINGGGGARIMLTATDARSDRAEATLPAPLSNEPMVAMPFIFAVQVGHLITPIATFVRIVHETPELRSNSTYKTRADGYLKALHQAVDVHDYEWRENEAGEGWLHWVKGAPVAFDGCDQPHNQYLSLGRTMIQLAAVTTDPVRKATYLDRARKMANTFKNDLQLSDDGETVQWTYFWSKGKPFEGWTAEENVSQTQPAMVWPRPGGVKTIEDTSHAVLDIDFARLAFENDLGVFTERDMKRFARTFIEKMLTEDEQGIPTVAGRVDGTGSKGISDDAAAAWIMLAPYEPTIYQAMLKNYQSRRPQPGPATILLGIAYMNWFSRRQG